MRRITVDGAWLYFDRRTGWTARVSDDSTAALALGAPRAVQMAITNRCNLACSFCSRDVEAASEWTAEGAFELLAELSARGVLEVAFGGGEPFAFRGIEALVGRLHKETELAVSLTTNGVLLDRHRVRAIAGRYAQIRVSLYDEPDARSTVDMLVEEEARFGVNWLLTPERLPRLERVVLDLARRGCGDVLLLAYKGADASLHLTRAQTEDAARRIALLARGLAGRVQLKLDVCWGSRMAAIPQIARADDCGAGRDFVVVTSDRRVTACSFHHRAYPIRDAEDVMNVWRQSRAPLRGAARIDGCARPSALLPVLA